MVLISVRQRKSVGKRYYVWTMPKPSDDICFMRAIDLLELVRNKKLSAREVNLLEILLQCCGRLVSKDQLVSHLCEWGEEVSPNAIEVYVHRLRKKLEPGGVHIVTIRGLGYRLEKTPQV